MAVVGRHNVRHDLRLVVDDLELQLKLLRLRGAMFAFGIVDRRDDLQR